MPLPVRAFKINLFFLLFFKNKDNNIYFVVDEAHYIKQLGGAWAQSVLSIAPYANKKCILTGTPIPKNYSDLYNLFDFLWPEKTPITSENKIKLSVCEQSDDFQSAKNILEKVVLYLILK